jgi:CRISPR-associated protein Cas2
MFIIVTYDVNTETPAGRKRLRRVARACLDYGERVQNSVFECSVSPTDLAKLKGRLIKESDTSSDSIRIYFIDEDARKKIIHLGVKKPRDPDSPIII